MADTPDPTISEDAAALPVAILPTPEDNVAVATRPLRPGDAGPVVRGGRLRVNHTVPEGHRVVVAPVAEGDLLLSWGRPFAVATRDMTPGDYVLSERMRDVLTTRRVEGQFPEPNAVDHPLLIAEVDAESFATAEREPVLTDGRTFLGYDRGQGLGVGTRNHVVVVATSSRTGAFVQALERRLQDIGRSGPVGAGLDPLVSVVHTEGGRRRLTHNRDLVLRTLAGYAVHPNVGALLAVDEPDGGLGNTDLQTYLDEHDYPKTGRPVAFVSRRDSVAADLDRCEELIRSWVPQVVAERTEHPLSELTLALQCGGSDAFSGITANPLAGAVARELVRRGGTAILAETDELVGAEDYVVARAASVDVARSFLETVARFKEQVGRHGHTAKTNVAGGNLWRGLYNISIKSLGAARKLDPRLLLDHVLAYSEPLRGRRGYVFMDSPGNDLESIAGEVAVGATVIFFTTGNGSVTNFPFVPTVKLVSTTGRYNLLPAEMDVDAGRLLTGTGMEELTQEVLDLTVAVTSGQRSAGERAGHSQVSLWRDWSRGPDESAADPEQALSEPEVSGSPLPIVPGDVDEQLVGELTDLRVPQDVALVMPTSICSGQVARRIATRLGAGGADLAGVTEFAAPVHTEGCGSSSGASEAMFARVVLGHVAHPRVRHALMLEHGCEKTHNAYFRDQLESTSAADLTEHLGWASIQLDGGIEAVEDKVLHWYADAPELKHEQRPVAVGLHAVGPVPDVAAHQLVEITRALIGGGHAVVLMQDGVLLQTAEFRALMQGPPEPSLRHGQPPMRGGLHVMAGPAEDWLEALAAMAGGGASAVVAHVSAVTVPAHPFVPVLQVSADARTVEARGPDLDLALAGDGGEDALALARLLARCIQGEHVPVAKQAGLTGFQVSRGQLGVSI